MTRYEQWADIPDWPQYEISNRKRVASKHRVVIRRDGKPCTTTRRILKLSYSRAKGIASVTLADRGRKRTLNVDALMSQIWGRR
jgi:hypothetical protein